MSRRKTIEVSQLVAHVNESLRTSTDSPEVRLGMILLLDKVLFETGNYNGFRYLYEYEVPSGHRPGINATADFDAYDAKFKDTDKTRVNYS